MSRIAAVRTVLHESPPQQLPVEVEVEVETGRIGLGECWWGMPNGDPPGSGARGIEVPWVEESIRFPSGVTVSRLEDGRVYAPAGPGLAL